MLVSGAKCCRNLVSSGGSCESYSRQKQALASPCRWPWVPVGCPWALFSRWSTDIPFHLHCKYSCACLASLVSICSPLLFILCLGSRSPFRSAEGCVTLGGGGCLLFTWDFFVSQREFSFCEDLCTVGEGLFCLPLHGP